MNGLPQLQTARLRLQHAEPSMAAAHAEFMRRNRAHLAPWEPPHQFDLLDAGAWTRHLAQSVEAWAGDREVRWVLREPDGGMAVPGSVAPESVALEPDAPIIGRINFTQIERGPFQSCRLGYQIDARFEGRGLMREALAAAIDWLFAVKELHRIEANYRPENARSGALLARLGFERTGLAREYLFIAGAWRDHVQMQRLNTAFDPALLAGG
jgi:ribosomal-protein-alanine N-acetyltransferase